MKCQVCSQETLLPFRCPFCGGQFCSAHRLPENHACPRIDFARSQRQEQVITPQSYNSYQYTYNFGQQPRRERHVTSSPKEIKHITVAARLSSALVSPSDCTETISEASILRGLGSDGCFRGSHDSSLFLIA